MDADERTIYYYLKQYRQTYLSGREIGRRAAGKSRFRDEPDWAVAPLLRMVKRQILETDPAGAFRIKPRPDDKSQLRRFVSPQVQQILRDSGKTFEGVIEIDEAEVDSYYEKL